MGWNTLAKTGCGLSEGLQNYVAMKKLEQDKALQDAQTKYYLAHADLLGRTDPNVLNQIKAALVGPQAAAATAGAAKNTAEAGKIIEETNNPWKPLGDFAAKKLGSIFGVGGQTPSGLPAPPTIGGASMSTTPLGSPPSGAVGVAPDQTGKMYYHDAQGNILGAYQ